MIKEDIIFFIGHINDIGGVEQWIYYISKKYGHAHNITMVFKKAKTMTQIQRLVKNIRCIKYNGEKIECNTIFYCYDLSVVKQVKAKEQILTIHADYKKNGLKIEIPKEITKIYAVSESARQPFEETHGDQLKRLGLEIKVLYNPIALDEPKKALKLVSATRLTKEKGLFRMQKLAQRLNERGIQFYWLVFTNERPTSDIPNFIYMKPTLDIIGYIKDADYLVQLSDTESYAYSIVEAACLGTPVLVTDFPVIEEIGIKDGVNGYVFKMDMSNIDNKIDKIVSSDLKGFKYEPKHSEEEWDKLLGEKVTPRYKYDKEKQIMRIKIERPFFDTELKRQVVRNDEYDITAKRLEVLNEKVPGYFEVIGIRQEEPKEEIKEIEEQTQDLTEVIEEIKPKKRKK